VLAKRVVDATGDADIAARAGAPTRKTPREEMLAASVMFSMTGVNKRRFLDAVKADPQTYRDWAGNAEWDIETTGKEDELFSPFLRKPFKRAVETGLIPPNLITLAGTWGTVTDQGDLTYLNLVHLAEVDGTSADDLTRGEIEGRQASASSPASYMPIRGRRCGTRMTIGMRRGRSATYPDQQMSASGPFDIRSGSFGFIDGYRILILPTTGRYCSAVSAPCRKVANLIVTGRSIGGDRSPTRPEA
jgi:hypothetical protein